jgi:hypothetical protein
MKFRVCRGLSLPAADITGSLNDTMTDWGLLLMTGITQSPPGQPQPPTPPGRRPGPGTGPAAAVASAAGGTQSPQPLRPAAVVTCQAAAAVGALWPGRRRRPGPGPPGWAGA